MLVKKLLNDSIEDFAYSLVYKDRQSKENFHQASVTQKTNAASSRRQNFHKKKTKSGEDYIGQFQENIFSLATSSLNSNYRQDFEKRAAKIEITVDKSNDMGKIQNKNPIKRFSTLKDSKAEAQPKIKRIKTQKGENNTENSENGMNLCKISESGMEDLSIV